MFTGIIFHTGTYRKKENSKYLFKASSLFVKKLRVGTSISIDGACLTVVKIPYKNTFCVEVMPETLQKTIIGQYKAGTLVNLELPATPNTFLSGHIVQGHIDGVGKIKQIKKYKNSRMLIITFPQKLGQYIVEKGSIAINGISLTVIETRSHLGQGATLTIGITTYTWEHTMLKGAKTGDKVNIETDILAKYIWKKI